MPQIAQQEYLTLETSDLSNMTAEQRAKIQEYHKRKILFDLVIIDGGSQLRVVADRIDVDDTILVYSPADVELVSIDVSVE